MLENFRDQREVKKLLVQGGEVKSYQTVHASNDSGINWPFNEGYCVCYDATLRLSVSDAIRRNTLSHGPCEVEPRRHVSRVDSWSKEENKDSGKTDTRAPENMPADPTPAIARPMIRATDVGAAPHTTRKWFSMYLESIEVEVD